MASYWGLDAISKRMECSPGTLRRWYVERSFLMYQRRKNQRSKWFTNDALIIAWEQRECERQGKRLRLPMRRRKDSAATNP